jgi:protein-S-isoprenylcysteine O-methyltransferase Ste14
MARPGFKRIITSVIPEAAERSTYMLATNLAMILLFWQWRPLGGVIWNVQSEVGRVALTVSYALGWALVLLATFVINHFELFGLQQIWRNLFGTRTAEPKFKTPFLYRIVRHPLYVGWFIVFWSAPTMTVAHLVFALGLTTYILVAIQYEERDLISVHPEYAEYRRQVPMLVPCVTPRTEVPVPARTWNARS